MTHAGKISHKMALEKSGEEFEKYKEVQKQIKKESNIKELEEDLSILTKKIKVEINSQRIKPYTFPSRTKSQPHEPKLVKENVLPTFHKLNKNNEMAIMAKKHRVFGGKLKVQSFD